MLLLPCGTAWEIEDIVIDSPGIAKIDEGPAHGASSSGGSSWMVPGHPNVRGDQPIFFLGII